MPDVDVEWATVQVDGHEIHYRVAGPVDAPPMVHVHGFAISGTYLMPTAQLLAKNHRVFVPDLPGFGHSPKPAQQLSISGLGAALVGFMAQLDIERAILVGNSLGCAIIAEAIDQAPERVSRAILVSLAGGAHNQPLGRAMLQMARDGVREPTSLLPVAVPDYVRFGPLRALRLFVWMTRFPAYERFMAVEVPVLVVVGSDDPLRPSWGRISSVAAELPSEMTIVLFQGAAHAINFTHPEELAHVIEQYIAGEPIGMDARNPTGVPVLQLQRPR